MWTCCAVHIAPRGRHETSVTPLLRNAPRAPLPKEFISESLEVVGGRKLQRINAFQHHTLISQMASALPSPEPTRTARSRCSTDVSCRFQLSLSTWTKPPTARHVGGLAPHLDAVREELGDAVLDQTTRGKAPSVPRSCQSRGCPTRCSHPPFWIDGKWHVRAVCLHRSLGTYPQ